MPADLINNSLQCHRAETPMNRLVLRSSVVVAVLVCVAEAQAQKTPSPGKIFNCTQLTDPTELRFCIEAQQGVVSQPEASSAPPPSTAASSDPYRLQDRPDFNPPRNRNQPP
jgi:hypothetical protein